MVIARSIVLTNRATGRKPAVMTTSQIPATDAAPGVDADELARHLAVNLTDEISR
jgi:hypothetical protein